MTVQHQAACHCGQLRARFQGDPLIVSSCHCLACQRRTGAVFSSNAFFKRDQAVAIEGEHRAWCRTAESGRVLTLHFCPTCGSTIFWEREGAPDMLTVAVGAFADPAFPAPVVEAAEQGDAQLLREILCGAAIGSVALGG